jgi:hypothetical protein
MEVTETVSLLVRSVARYESQKKNRRAVSRARGRKMRAMREKREKRSGKPKEKRIGRRERNNLRKLSVQRL